MKIKSLNALVDEVAVLLQKRVRLKAALSANKSGFIECVTCNKWYHWKNMQGGHWIERGKKATKTLEENIHPQCAGCNQYGMKHRTLVRENYSKYMREMYGDDFCEQLLINCNRPVKFYREDLKEQIKELKKENKEMEAQL
jgi:hypothetical protein